MPSENVRNLMLGRVVKIAEQQNGGMKPNQSIVREATRLLDARLNGGVTLTDKDLRNVAISAVKNTDSANTNLAGGLSSSSSPLHGGGHDKNNSSNNQTANKIQRGALTNDIFNTNTSRGGADSGTGFGSSSTKVHHLPPIGSLSTSAVGLSGLSTPSPTGRAEGEADQGGGDISSLIVNTTKRQRKILAEREWARVAEEDRIRSKMQTLKEKENHLKTMAEQRAKLDQQKKEIEDRREEERRMQERQKQQVTEHIQLHKQLTLKEQQEARDKALAEKRAREQQHKESSEARERVQKTEYEEQMRRLMVLNEQQKAQKEADINSKLKKQQEWREVLRLNEERTRDKLLQKERERAEDREFQRKYKENQERIEAERAAMYARKDAKQKQRLELADRVADQFSAKEKDHLGKIQQEYDTQLRMEQEDEVSRKRVNKMKMQECLNFQQQQIAEKKRLEEARKEEDRRLAEEVRQQILENKREEQARKMTQQQEQLRMRQFLNTQLQMAHFKETQEPETSIMRPPHATVNMFNTAAIRSGSRLSTGNGK